jgi:hypothetical protein
MSGDGHFLIQSEYENMTKPILVTQGPSRPHFLGLARVSGDGHFLIQPLYANIANPFR